MPSAISVAGLFGFALSSNALVASGIRTLLRSGTAWASMKISANSQSMAALGAARKSDHLAHRLPLVGQLRTVAKDLAHSSCV
jgi:hypothetical protein